MTEGNRTGERGSVREAEQDKRCSLDPNSCLRVGDRLHDESFGFLHRTPSDPVPAGMVALGSATTTRPRRARRSPSRVLSASGVDPFGCSATTKG